MKRKTALLLAAMVAGALILVGCGRSSEQTPQTQVTAQKPDTVRQDTAHAVVPPKDTVVVAQVPEPRPAPKELKTVVERKTTPPPSPPEIKRVTIPAGTTLAVSLVTPLRTDSNKYGDPFTATVTQAVEVEGKTIIPTGAEVGGRLILVEEPHRTAGRAKLSLSFETVTVNGQTHALKTQPVMLEGEPDKISDEAKVIGGGVVGGVIGALTSKDKKKGAAIGAAVGAAAGGAAALATKGGQLVLSPGQQFNVEMTAPAEVPVASKAADK